MGGEQGAVRKDGKLFTVALCFPDLYEIGMSNNAMRILYSGLNALPGLRCERVFAPARDFEALLRETGTPLFTLESGIPLRDADVLAFTVGYELAATNILTVLDLGNIPLLAEDRGARDPVVIAGGPAITNPHPMSRFLDAVWIGEAEAGFFDLAAVLAASAGTGRPGREAVLARLRDEKAFWMKGKKAVRAIDSDFPDRDYDVRFPWPSIKPVQDHGTVEIMRGCPNGCRFCHAGYYYRPQRVRSPERIFREVEALVTESGYREITLASLSSGDYPGIEVLVRELNRRWGGRRVSFQLPSLKVESFTLPVIEELAHTRKSGLTFAVETPEEAWQRSINKTVTLDKILGILDEAGRHGYRLAKFYFMIGLPVPDFAGTSEAEAMISFLKSLLSGSGFQLNVNIGTFIPKPHTPFQWSPQLSEEEALSRIRTIREAFRTDRRIKISYHTPFISFLEGILSRGDERVGGLVFDAWSRGARLDAWEDLMDREAWKEALAAFPSDALRSALDGRSPEDALPWDDVYLRVSRKYLQKELELSRKCLQTPACMDNCTDICGSCGPDANVVKNIILPRIDNDSEPASRAATDQTQNTPAFRLVVQFSKRAAGAFLPHHSVIDALYRAFQLSRLPVAFSEGFNPLPRLEIEEPIPLGLSSGEDYFSVLLVEEADPVKTLDALNRRLPPDLAAREARLYALAPGVKNRSLSTLYWGSDFLLASPPEGAQAVLAEALEDPRLRGSSVFPAGETAPDALVLRLKAGGSREVGFGALFQKTYGAPYAQGPGAAIRIRQWADVGAGPVSYFDALDGLYGRS